MEISMFELVLMTIRFISHNSDDSIVLNIPITKLT
jgi:hypothetical protein